MNKMNKEEFKMKAKKSIDDVFAKIDALEAKKDKVKGDVKAEYEEKINNFKTKKKELQAKYDALVNTSDEKWEEVKSTFSSATESFKEGFSKIESLI
jgi:outer membrane murein-binding lipoprotein Lpp